MLEKYLLTVLEIVWNQRLGHKKTKLKICHHMLTSSTQLQNRSFHVVEKTRTSTKCQKMKNARAKRAKILFFFVKYANLCCFCCRRRRGCLSSLMQGVNNLSLVDTIGFHFIAIATNLGPWKAPMKDKLHLKFSKSLMIHLLMTQPACINWVRCAHFDTQ